MQVIQLGFRIVVITAVTERVAVPDMACIGNVCAVRILHRMVPPCVVPVFYHSVPVAVKNGGNISLRVFTVKICRIIVFYAGNARLVVNELQSVALLYDSAVFIVGKGNAALAYFLLKERGETLSTPLLELHI